MSCVLKKPGFMIKILLLLLAGTVVIIMEVSWEPLLDQADDMATPPTTASNHSDDVATPPTEVSDHSAGEAPVASEDPPERRRKRADSDEFDDENWDSMDESSDYSGDMATPPIAAAENADDEAPVAAGSPPEGRRKREDSDEFYEENWDSMDESSDHSGDMATPPITAAENADDEVPVAAGSSPEENRKRVDSDEFDVVNRHGMGVPAPRSGELSRAGEVPRAAKPSSGKPHGIPHSTIDPSVNANDAPKVTATGPRQPGDKPLSPATNKNKTGSSTLKPANAPKVTETGPRQPGDKALSPATNKNKTGSSTLKPATTGSITRKRHSTTGTTATHKRTKAGSINTTKPVIGGPATLEHTTASSKTTKKLALTGLTTTKKRLIGGPATLEHTTASSKITKRPALTGLTTTKKPLKGGPATLEPTTASSKITKRPALTNLTTTKKRLIGGLVTPKPSKSSSGTTKSAQVDAAKKTTERGSNPYRPLAVPKRSSASTAATVTHRATRRPAVVTQGTTKPAGATDLIGGQGQAETTPACPCTTEKEKEKEATEAARVDQPVGDKGTTTPRGGQPAQEDEFFAMIHGVNYATYAMLHASVYTYIIILFSILVTYSMDDTHPPMEMYLMVIGAILNIVTMNFMCFSLTHDQLSETKYTLTIVVIVLVLLMAVLMVMDSVLIFLKPTV